MTKLKEAQAGKTKVILEQDNDGKYSISILDLTSGGPYMGYEILDTEEFDTLKEAEQKFKTLTKIKDYGTNQKILDEIKKKESKEEKP